MGRAIRVGLDACRTCSGVAVTAERFCEHCAAAIEAGDREALAERAVTMLVARFKPMSRDLDGLRRAAMTGQAWIFEAHQAPERRLT